MICSFNWVNAYDPGSSEDFEELYWSYTWALNADGSYVFDWTYDSSDPEYDVYLYYSVVVYEDGSGEIEYYLLDELIWEMEWDAAGNGSYTWYFGDFTDTGSWTV